jgi:hypothetical protein
MNICDILGPRRPIRSMESYWDLCLTDKAFDQTGLPLGDEIVSTSGINEPFFNHTTLDEVKISFLECGYRTTFMSLGPLLDPFFQFDLQKLD